jgi:hypothetical protein
VISFTTDGVEVLPVTVGRTASKWTPKLMIVGSPDVIAYPREISTVHHPNRGKEKEEN